MHRAARTAALAVIAAGACLLAGGARAEFDQERQLYMLNRLELENAEAMLDFYQDKFAGTTKAAVDLKKRKDARRTAAHCDSEKPGSIGICQRIESDYKAGIRVIAALREDVRASLLTQRAQVERLRAQFNAAIANYVTAVALRAAVEPAGGEDEVKKPMLAPPQNPISGVPKNALQSNAPPPSQGPRPPAGSQH